MTAFFDSFLAEFQPVSDRWPTPGDMAVDLGFRAGRHPIQQSDVLQLIDRELTDWADGVNPKLMLFCPPQEGKSQRVSRVTPTWLLARDPSLRIAIVSFSSEKAERWGKAIRADVAEHPQLADRIRIRPDSRAAAKIETMAGGSVICVGIAGGITGEPVDVLIIDDPIRGRAEAESLTYRDAAWDWWESNAATRQSARFRALLMMTRWHEDDLAGRLQAREPGRWRTVSIPAIADAADDPLGREPGVELLSVQGREPGYFHDLKTLRSPYVFASMYQQHPVPAEGGLFKRTQLRYWRPATSELARGDKADLGQALVLDGTRVWVRDMWRFGTVDLASSTRTSADWSVVSIWGVTADDQLLLLDRARARLDETRHWNIARPLVERWAPEFVGVEDAKKSMTLVSDLTTAGVPWKPLNPDTDKITRAIPASNRVQDGRLWLPGDAPWLDEFIDELVGFPNAAHDDQVDTLAYAALELARGRTTSGVVAIPATRHDRLPADMAPTGVDLLAEAF